MRGFRVEPGEVEAALRTLPACARARVAARRDPCGAAAGGLRGAAAAAPTRRRCRAALGGAAPGVHGPRHGACALDALPRTANGKIDRRALPAPGRRRGAGTPPPRLRTRRCWRRSGPRCCRPGRSARDDDFFERGGHSLLATQLVSRMRRGVRGGDAAARGVRGAGAGERARRAPCSGRGEGAPAGRRPAGGPRMARCRSRSRRSGCGSSTSSSRGAPPTTSLSRCDLRGRAGRGRAGARAGRDRPAPRAAAHRLRRPRRPAGAGGDPPLPRLSAGPRPISPASRRMSGTPRAGRAGGGAAAVRPGRRARAAGHAAGAGGRGAHAGASFTTSSPTRGRGGSSSASWRRCTRRSPRARSAARRPAGAVRRLRGVAARLAARGGPGEQAGFWRSRLAGAPAVLELPTDRPRPAVPDVCGALVPFLLPPETAAAAARAGQARGRHAVHGAARRLPGRAAPLERRGGRGGRHPHRRPHAARAGGADRLLRQHAGAARPTSPATRRSPRCWAACARPRWAPTRTRTSPSKSWWTS